MDIVVFPEKKKNIFGSMSLW